MLETVIKQAFLAYGILIVVAAIVAAAIRGIVVLLARPAGSGRG